MGPSWGGQSNHPRQETRNEGTEGGYTLVVFVMLIAVMAIMMGVAVQSVEFAMQREREAELIFRGEQYIEAIRLYRLKYGRYPMRLKEIWEANPKVIRQAWKDPFTDSTDWGLVFLGQDGQQIGGGEERRQQGGGSRGRGRGRQRGVFDSNNTPVPGTGGSGADTEFSRRGGQTGGGQSGGEKVGPIVGVHSTDCRDSIKVYEGRTRVCEWKFVFREDKRRGQPGSQGAGQGGTPVPDGTPTTGQGSGPPSEDDGQPFGTQPQPRPRPRRTPR
jgi:type II secretory pathway pseudopilin PulG